ncbi:glycosyltransferase [Benzoatithermus flavus]|uniref:Glycosyltransferase n=1 Tax=Benzoatithermus flavus TaxID=3108223 RepID=A0ABU8XWQ9_9PROT
MKICIATIDIHGPIRNGGIGTAYTKLALLLAQAGHEVTIAFLLGERCEQGSISRWQQWYAERGVTFEPALLDHKLRFYAPPQRAESYLTYLWLRSRPVTYDVVHFPEWRGYGYYAMLAKRLGLDFQDTTFCVGTHSPTLWHTLGNHEPVNHFHQLDVNFLEAQSIALADLVVSPSRYMLDWIREQGWTLPERTLVLPNVMLDRPLARPAGGGAPVSELVFFGRLEERKGLALFCDAVDRLVPVLQRPLTITFLGKPGDIRGERGDAYAAKRAAAWPFPCRTIPDKDRDGALAYLAAPGRLAVMPSLVENSPYTVLECLTARIPFLAAGVGGIPELIAPEDRDRACFVPQPQLLADKLAQALAAPNLPVRCAFDIEANHRAWLELHGRLGRERRTRPAATAARPLPLVSVCMTTRNRPELLARALDSVRAQDYPHFEVVLVDDGSDRPEALAYLDRLEPEFERRGWRIVRQANRYPGAARNAAVAQARGTYVKFMDDDNVTDPDELSTFVKAALASDADILTCVLRPFEGDDPTARTDPVEVLWLPAGANVALGAFENCFGDVNALIRKEAFEALGGFSEDYGVGHEDWELFARAALKGFRLYVVPRPLVRYRVSKSGVQSSTSVHANYARSLRPYLGAVPPGLRDALRLAQATFIQMHPASAGLLVRRKKDPAKELDRIKRSVTWRVTKPLWTVEKSIHRQLEKRRLKHRDPA